GCHFSKDSAPQIYCPTYQTLQSLLRVKQWVKVVIGWRLILGLAETSRMNMPYDRISWRPRQHMMACWMNSCCLQPCRPTLIPYYMTMAFARIPPWGSWENSILPL